ncbi:MAG: DUF4056 domain-containing protein [Candidatus Binatia bacterium]
MPAAVRVLFLCATLAACGTAQKWSGDPAVTPDLVAREISPELSDGDFTAADVPNIPLPGRLRPCCAFGSGLKVTLLSVPMPGVELANVVGVEDLGPHQFDNGALAFEASRPGGAVVNDEHNGLIYTCRGGFIDTAHLRDWADWSLAIGGHIARSLESGTTIALPDEGGRRHVVVAPVDATVLAEHGRREIAVPLAQWLAFQLSVWHEIATWFGWSALPMFSEEASAFSPEDLYSNLLGIRIAGTLVYGHGVASEVAYNENMNDLIARLLRRLGALPAADGRQAALAVDGLWWDSSVALPAKQLVRRRNFAIGTSVAPWLVTDAPVSSDAKRRIAAACAGSAQPIDMRNPDTCAAGQMRFDRVATVEIVVGAELIARGFPLPRRGDPRITQADFPSIITAIRAANATEFGPAADRPD